MNLSLIPNSYINKAIFSYAKPFNNSFKGNTAISEDTFIRTTPITQNPFESDKRKFEISDYKALSKKEIEEIKTKFCSKEEIKIARRDVKIARNLKRHLDKEYGEGNYIFECVGTSPSTIARVFEFMGVETHYLPITGLRARNKITVESAILRNKEGRSAYSEFLKSQGVDKKSIKNSDKIHIFYDYTATGDSLKLFREILKDCFHIPTKNGNVKFKSLNKDLLKIYPYPTDESGYCINDGSVKRNDCYHYVHDELERSEAAQYGGVPHLNYEMLQFIKNFQEKPSDSSSKSFNFLVIDELNKLKLLKENPANKNSL